MNRRGFLTHSLGGVIGLSRPSDGDQDAQAPPSDAVTALAGAPIGALRDRWRAELFDEVLPLLRARVVDHQYGGFICTLDADGSHGDDTKDTGFQGRGIWVYSFLYNNFGRQPEHLAIARAAVDLTLKSMPAGGDTSWPARLGLDGRPLAAPPETIAADVSIAEGLAEFSRATGEPRYRELAKRILLRCRTIYDRSDYAPDIVRVYCGPTPVTFLGARSQGAAMILLGTISPMLEKDPDSELEAIASASVEALVGKHYDPDFHLNIELLNHDYSRPANELAQFVYTGHCLEALGFLLMHAARTKDRQLFDLAAARFRRHAEVAWDDVYGGFFRSLNDVAEDRWELNKVLWVQEEALSALLLLIEHTGDRWARDVFERTLAYVDSTYYINRWGSRFWISGGDRLVTNQPNLTRVEHYHHPRRLMFGILTLDRMIGRRGGV